MAERTDTRKLLVLHGPELEAQGILAFFREHFEVHVTRELDEALEAMRHHRFEAVLAETANFLPLERGIVTQQAAVILDTIGEGVCITGPGGELAWTNRRAREFPPAVLGPLRDLCRQAYLAFASADRHEGESARRFSLMPESDTFFEVICSPIRDAEGVLRQVVAVVINSTTQRRQQLKLNAIDRAGRELVRLDFEALSNRDASQRLRLLEERIIRYSREVLHYPHFAVLLLDDKTNRLEVIVSEGISPAAQKYGLLAGTENNGICGYVAATGRSYICGDVRKDPRYLVGMDGAGSSLTVPLRLHDKVVGVLNVESDRVGAFGEEDRQFAEIFGNYVALALNILNLLIFERYTTHSHVSGSISAELAGPLNDIISEATSLMEDYIGHDDLRERLSAIVERASDVRKTVQKLTQMPTTGVLSTPSQPIKKDAVLAGKRVLVADDEELIRQTIGDVLSSCGCYVDLAADGEAARRSIRQAPYDLIISDINMPGATGYEVFEAAKAARAQVPVILITGFGYDPHHSIVQANREGLAAVLFKPFKVKQLLDECRAAITSAPK